jgi:hypothetical protein
MTWSDVMPDVAGAGHDVGDVKHQVYDVVIDIGNAIVEVKKKPHRCGFVLPWAGLERRK